MKVLSGATVLDTVTISVKAVDAATGGYKAASWNFDNGTQGWFGNTTTTTSDGKLYIAVNGGSSYADAKTTCGEDLKLIPGHLYRLTFSAKAWDVWGLSRHGMYTTVTDYKADGTALAQSLSLHELAMLSTDGYRNFEYRFVASEAADYAYSEL